MSEQSWEFRTEEELVGNLLVVYSFTDYSSQEVALETLWITAQEYHVDTSDVVKAKDYEAEKRKFSFDKIGFKEFLKKLDEVLVRYRNYLSSNAEYSKIEKIFGVLCDDFNENSNVYLLEEDYSTSLIFLVCEGRYALVSWNDVI